MKKILIIHWVALSKRKIEIYQIKKLKKNIKFLLLIIKA